MEKENISLLDKIKAAVTIALASEDAKNIFKNQNISFIGKAQALVNIYGKDLDDMEKDLFISYIIWPDDKVFIEKFQSNYNFVKEYGCSETLPYKRFHFLKKDELEKAQNDPERMKDVAEIASELVAGEKLFRQKFGFHDLNKDEELITISYYIWPDDSEFKAHHEEEPYNNESYFGKFGNTLGLSTARVAYINNPNKSFVPEDILALIKDLENKENKIEVKRIEKAETNDRPFDKKVIENLMASAINRHKVLEDEITSLNKNLSVANEEKEKLQAELLNEKNAHQTDIANLTKENEELRTKVKTYENDIASFKNLWPNIIGTFEALASTDENSRKMS